MKTILGKTAKMTFQLVDENASIAQAEKGIVPIGDELLYEDQSDQGRSPISQSSCRSASWWRATG